MPDLPHRIVLDTNAWLDLLVFRDARMAFLGAALASGRALALTSEACREEGCRVLTYEALALSPEQQQQQVPAFDALAIRHDVPDTPTVSLPRCRDPDDQKFLELALACRARWLVSRDKALLRLNRKTLRGNGFAILVPEAWTPEPSSTQISKR